MKKRLLALLLALTLLVACLPHIVLAEGVQSEGQEQETTEGQVEETTTEAAVVIEPHSHSNAHICEDCEDANVVWKKWDNPNALPNTTGHYYLSTPVKVSAYADVKGTADVVLCLNGYTVDAQQKSCIYRVSGSAKVTLADCTAHTDADGNYVAGQLTGGKEQDRGAIIHLDNNARFQMFGGKLTGGLNTQTSSSMGYSGGAIHARGNAYVYLKDCEISDNHTTAEGGAICLRETNAVGDTGAAVYCENVTFKNNVADRKGGVIFLNSAKNSVTMKNCTVEDNSSKGSAGAIYSNKGRVTLENCAFKKNSCTNNGGAIFMAGGSLTVTDGSITESNANQHGGAVYMDGGAAANMHGNVSITDNTTPKFGGAFYLIGSNTFLTMHGGQISGNSADNGGAITLSSSAGFKLVDGAIENNKAVRKGGALYLNSAGVTTYLVGGSITGNSAKTGGAIHQEANANKLIVRGGQITGNTASENGGAIYCDTNSVLQMEMKSELEIMSNTAAGAANNVHLTGTQQITFANLGTGTGKVGVTANSGTLPRAISTDMGSTDLSASFVSDAPYREIIVKDGKLYMQNATNHKHCDCVNIGGDNCDHTTNVWTPWEKTNALPTTSGYYFLTADVNTTGRQNVKGTNEVHLCLNGFTVNGNNKCIYEVGETGKLTLTDCTAHTDEDGNYMAGTFTGGKEQHVGGALYIKDNGEVRMFGGKLTGNSNVQTNTSMGYSGGAIQVRNNGKLLMVGTELSDNHTTAEGGAICLRDGGQAVLENCTFRNNVADRKGGAIFVNNTANRLTMKDCTFTGNTSDTGAALNIYLGTVQIDGCTFDGNTAVNEGGVMRTSGGKLTITNSTFTGNAGANGGAIRLTGNCEATIIGSTFTGNYATTSGGAISSADSNLTLENNKINENISDGTAGALFFAGKDKVLTLVSGEFVGNTAGAAGGAILVQSRAKYEMKDGTFTGNITTGGDGGAIYISTNCTGVMENGTITGNTAQKYGGGIALFGSVFTINDGLISGNTAANGAGITGRSGIRTEDGKEIRDVGAVFTMNGGKITENVASTGDGGGLQFAGDNCAATINGGEISGNTAASGGGIIAMTNAVITINDGKITGNTTTRNGGGIFMSFTSVLNVTGGEISGNKAANGGGIYLYGGHATLTGGKITKNTAKTNGGGIGGGGGKPKTEWYRGLLDIKNATISDNTAETGGGVSLTVVDVNIGSGTVVTGNYATKACGGILIMSDSIVKMTGGMINYNTAAGAACGGLYLTNNSTLTMVGGTISYNQCKYDGGGVYLQQSTGYFYGGSIVGNQSREGAGGGMRVAGSKAYLYGTSIRDNTAKTNAGGVVLARFKNKGVDYLPYLTIDGSTISGNKAEGPAGGLLLMTDGKTVFKSGVIENNESGGNGGGIYVSTNHTFEMSGGEIRNNKAGNQGGGVYHLASFGNYTGGKITGNEAVKNGGGMVMTGASDVTMKDFAITDNSGWTAGGFILNNQNVKFTAENCDFSCNKAVEAHAGAFYIVWGVTDALMKNCTIADNYAKQDGGAIYLINGNQLTMTDCTITGNTAGRQGGAMWSRSPANLVNCVISNNTAGTEGGGICTGAIGTSNMRFPIMKMQNCTLENNTAGTQGGGMYLAGGFWIETDGLTLKGNTSKLEGSAIWVVDESTFTNLTATGNTSENGGYAVYYGDSGFDGLSYIRGFHKIGGEVIIKDNKGGNLYLGEQTTLAIGAEGLTGDSEMHVKLDSGLLTQRIYGAYDYEGGNCEYVLTAGEKSLTNPEFDASMLPQAEEPSEEPTETPTGEDEQNPNKKVSPVILIAGGAMAAVIAAVAIIIVTVSKKKKPAAGK